MATTDLKFWDGSAWVSVGSVAGDLIRLPVAAADGKSQVNGADGLISIENTTPGGEAGMIFVTANDGTRWRTNVEEGLAAGQMTFYNAANEPVFTMRQNGDVILEQGGPDNSGGIAATEGFVRTLMNTFPLIDDGNDTQSSYARVDTDNDGPNMKTIYFGIGGQSVQNPDRILSISIDNSAEEDTLKKHITAHEDYTPSDPQDLVTLSYMQNNGASGNLPITSEDETVVLESLNPNEFSVSTNEAPRLKIDDGSTYILPKGPVSSTLNDETLTNAARFYTDVSNNYCGVGITTSTFNIAACNAVGNIRLHTESKLVAAFNRSYTQFYIDIPGEEPRCQFAVGSYGTIGLGSNNGSGSVTAKTQGVRAVWKDQILQNWISYYDINIIEDQTDNDGSDPLNPIVKNVYGHWVQHSTADPTGGASPIAFYNPAPSGDGTFDRYVGFASEHNTRATSRVVSFQSNQNQIAGVDTYCFWANGTAPSLFRGDIQCTYLKAYGGAENDASIKLDSRTSFSTLNQHQFYAPEYLVPNPDYVDEETTPDEEPTINQGSAFNALNIYDTTLTEEGYNQISFQLLSYGMNYKPSSQFGMGPGSTVLGSIMGGLGLYAPVDEQIVLGLGNNSDPDSSGTLYIERSDIRARAGYAPPTDDSLVTKGWVTDNAIPIYAPDGKAIFNADDFQNQVDWINKAGDTITPSANDVFYITANATGSETATVALFNGQAGKPKRGLHILNRNGDTARVNGHTILEQRSADSAGQVGTNPASALGVLSMNVDGWQHIRMSRGNVAIGDTTTSYNTVKLNVSGEIISSSSFGVYLETTVVGADATEENSRNFYGFTSTPRLEADISYLYHFRPYYSSSPTPTKTVLVEENGFLVDNKITQTCPKRIAFKSTLKPINDADRSFYVSTGSSPSEFGSEIRCNTFTTQFSAEKDISMSLGGQFMYIESGDDNVYTFNSNNHFVVGSKSSNVNVNRAGIEIHDSVFPEMIFSTDADASAADTVALRRSGSSFYINAQAVGDDVKIATGNIVRLTISDNDIAAISGYEPQTDDSLVNKKYCDDEISQAIAGSGGDTTVVEGTPTSSTEPDAAPGSMMFDFNFLYLKTSTAGWRKVPLMAFNDASAVARVTVQMTQAQYDALGTKDPSTLYVIVG